MRLTLLKSKLHGATVTGADLNYEGSIALGPDLRRLARLREYERVEIYNCHNGARLATYVIASNRDGARLVRPGDRVIIAACAEFTPTEARRHRPAIILLDPQNRGKRNHPPDSCPSSCNPLVSGHDCFGCCRS